MHREHLAAERAGDPLPVVDEDVEREVDPDRRRDRPDRIVDRVADGHAPGRHRVADPGGVVEREHGLEAREPGCRHLRPAAEPGEEVGFHEPGRDPEVGRDPLATHGDRHVADQAEVHERGFVASVVVHDPPPAEHLRPQHLEPLRLRARAVRAGRDEHDHVLVPHGAVQDLPERGELEPARLWPGDVAHGDRDMLTLADEVPEGGPAIGCSIATRNASSGSGAGCWCRGSTIVASSGTSTSRPVVP